jgi:hypothetical protein
MISCPGRGAAFFMPLRRAGTVTNIALWYGPALCSAPLRKSYALRCVRGTRPYFSDTFLGSLPLPAATRT